ncbi:hypothetical protein [Vagococcus humatus]|uniref:Uncharacterized protein n=1 Tax=Vagococcus humatus TaxID=1889241 RepID=A0A3R9YDZ7_9ENTE|nr:hypothetical protein [Vagococcus humatus]RST89063.1 hypothetical protein C7P63_07165 [Vagococcus humatus]
MIIKTLTKSLIAFTLGVSLFVIGLVITNMALTPNYAEITNFHLFLSSVTWNFLGYFTPFIGYFFVIALIYAILKKQLAIQSKSSLFFAHFFMVILTSLAPLILDYVRYLQLTHKLHTNINFSGYNFLFILIIAVLVGGLAIPLFRKD